VARKRHRRPPLKNFISGTENQIAWSAVCNLVEDPNSLPSPVVLHGPSGSGKSHLLGGMSAALRKRHPTLEQRHFTADRLTRACQASHYRREPQALAAELQALQVLLVDGLDQLSRRKATQHLLSGAIESIRGQGGQVILTARTTPHTIKGLSPELASRLHQGLLIRVDPASLQTRQSYLHREFLGLGVRLTPTLQSLIAARIADTGTLKAICEVLAHLARSGAPMRRALVEEVLTRHASGEPIGAGGPNLRPICALIEQARGLPAGSLHQRSGPRTRAAGRRLALWLAHSAGIPRIELADYFDLKPGSVSSALRKARAELEADEKLAAEMEHWRATLGYGVRD